MAIFPLSTDGITLVDIQKTGPANFSAPGDDIQFAVPARIKMIGCDLTAGETLDIEIVSADGSRQFIVKMSGTDADSLTVLDLYLDPTDTIETTSTGVANKAISIRAIPEARSR